MKNVTAKGMYPTQYTEYDDGSYDVYCSSCNKKDSVDIDRALKLKSHGSWIESYICLDCWKNKKDAERMSGKENRDNEITWGQAYNNAVNTVLHSGVTPFDGELFWKRVEDLQVSFYKNIKELKQKHELQ